MEKNAIILTNGLSGSSVLAGLIARAGYWTGASTFKKADYDTYENEQLVELNQRLLAASGYRGDYAMVFSAELVHQVAALYGKIEHGPFEDFVRLCERHRPWIWKDPRLTFTIRFWARFLDLSQCRFIVLTRGLWQSWVSTTLRRQIQTIDYLRRYTAGVIGAGRDFLREAGVPHLEVRYEDLIVKPQSTIEAINRFLGSALTLSDLQVVYKGRLHRDSRPLGDYLKAALIYLKNYGDRYR